VSHFISIKEFCARFHVGKTRAYALIRAGDIEAVKQGARTLITTASAERWAASLPRVPSNRSTT
jgi:excisionase family DNA binding protein